MKVLLFGCRVNGRGGDGDQITHLLFMMIHLYFVRLPRIQ